MAFHTLSICSMKAHSLNLGWELIPFDGILVDLIR